MMKKMLSQLLPGASFKSDVEVFGVSDDSRKIDEGHLFMAVSGENYNGSTFIAEALAKGVAAIAIDERDDIKMDPSFSVPVVKVRNLAGNRGAIASRFYDDPSSEMRVVGITGTNGKTSVSQYIAKALNFSGEPCGVVGTMGFGIDDTFRSPGLTTPDAVSLQKIMNILKREKAGTVTLEASSHGLVQGRLDDIEVDIAVFTNITRDHLDYHGSFGEYQSAKQKLFEFESLSAAIVNIDDPFGTVLVDGLADSVQEVTYSVNNTDADIHCVSLAFSNIGFEASLETPWGSFDVKSNLLGEFNVSNLLCVAGVMGCLGFSVEEMQKGISVLKNVKGRMDLIDGGSIADVVIDYAHTPDALEKAIKALMLHCKQDIWCVMGCGGDRDKGKRRLMGEVSTRLAQHTIVTDDNPRFEDPMIIINEIESGAVFGAKITIEPERKLAISFALDHANENDIVLIAGKGHEDYQEIQGSRHPYSDYDVVKNFMTNATNREQAS